MTDSEFLLRLARDPIGTAFAEGYAIDAEEIKALLGMTDIAHRDVVMILQARLARLLTTSS